MPPVRSSPRPDSRDRGGGEGEPVGGVGPQRAVALDQGDQALLGERRDEGGRHARRHHPCQLGGDAPPSQARALEQGRADDHRQGDGARKEVGVLPREAPPPSGGKGGAVAGHPRRQRRSLSDAQGETVRGGGVAGPLLMLVVSFS